MYVYGNLKSENSQDYAQRPSTKLYVHEFGFCKGLSPNFETFKEPKNRFQGISSDWLCSLAGRYDNPIPTEFLALIDCLKIPALHSLRFHG
jgi:hypothetical protein